MFPFLFRDKNVIGIHLTWVMYINALSDSLVGLKVAENRPGVVAQACNPSTLGGQGGWITGSRDRDHPGQHGETLSLLKTQEFS